MLCQVIRVCPLGDPSTLTPHSLCSCWQRKWPRPAVYFNSIVMQYLYGVYYNFWMKLGFFRQSGQIHLKINYFQKIHNCCNKGQTEQLFIYKL